MRGIGVGTAKPFVDAREFLLARRDEYADAYREFRWPALDRFNWALDWFDAYAAGNDRARALARGRRCARCGSRSPSSPRGATA